MFEVRDEVKNRRLNSFFIKISILLILLAMPTRVNASPNEIIIPSSEKSVEVDGIININEWFDAYHITYASYEGKTNDVYIKYDLKKELICVAFIIDDSTYAKDDSFFMYYDTNNNGGSYPKGDDYDFEIFRATYEPNQYVDLNVVVAGGTGGGWPNNEDYDYNMASLPYPFGTLTWARHEINRDNLNDTSITQGNSWGGEFTVSLPKTVSTQSGSVQQGLSLGALFGQYDYYEKDGVHQYTQVYWPSEVQKEYVISPDNWVKMKLNVSNVILYRLTVQSPDGSGSTDPVPTTYDYHQVSTVNVKATPSAGWQFDHWVLDGSDVGKINPYMVNMNANHTLKAVFTKIPVQYHLTIQPAEGTGSTNPIAGVYDYTEGTDIQVSATPGSEWKLDHWVVDGVSTGSDATIKISMTGDRVVKAVFMKLPTYKLTVEAPTGSGTTDPSSGTYTYKQVVTVPVKATPASGWNFDHWEVDGSNVGSTNPYVVNMGADHGIKAVFIAASSGGGIPGYPLEAIILGALLAFASLLELRAPLCHSSRDVT